MKYFMLLVMLCLTSLHAQDLTDTNETKYQNILKRVKSFDTTVSFYDFRMAYTKTAGYSPYGRDYVEVVKHARELGNKGEFKRALPELEQTLEKNYTNMEIQFQCLVMNASIDSISERTRYYGWLVGGMLRSMDSCGDALTPESAIPVITTTEEYFWLRMSHMRVLRQALLNKYGHSMDAMTCMDDNEQERVFYFMVDKLFESMSRMFKKK